MNENIKNEQKALEQNFINGHHKGTDSIVIDEKIKSQCLLLDSKYNFDIR
jgi:hypothetical protein